MANGDSLLSRIVVDGVGYKIFDETAVHVANGRMVYGVNSEPVVLYAGSADEDE